MDIAGYSIEKRVVTITLVLVCFFGGLASYTRIGRLEDPEFTIKVAQVITPYPGATAQEVAEEVTDKIETAVQQMGQLKEVTSTSYPGKSLVRVEIQDHYGKQVLPQVWDELRRKVNDVQESLPQGAGPSVVVDDYGDVFGVYYAVYGDGFSYAELKDYAKLLRRELLLCDDVAKIELLGARQEAVYFEISRAKMSQLGVAPEQIYGILQGQNIPASAGQVQIGDQYVRIHPTGSLKSVEAIGDLMVVVPGDGRTSRLRLRDLGTIRRDYVEPASVLVRYNGRPAVALGISTAPGGNVITMGAAIDRRLQELQASTPVGIEVGIISHQASTVNSAVNGFIVNLLESTLIVVAVLLVAMGLRSGLLIGGVLLLTVMCTVMVMDAIGLMFERISLGAFIIALGMLVDNAIVVTEGVLTASQRGEDKGVAGRRIVKQAMWPLLGATLVAVLSFAPVGASQDSTGEFCRSLFLVILISLFLSWVLAITVTPLFCLLFLPKSAGQKGAAVVADPYASVFFRIYRSFLCAALRWRWLTLVTMGCLLLLALVGFTRVKTSFFPTSTRPQFMVHCWLPQGSDISATEREVAKLKEFIAGLAGVRSQTSICGSGGLRFLLTYTPEDADASYGIIFVDVDDYKHIDALGEAIMAYSEDALPDSLVYYQHFVLGPGDPQKIQVRFLGDDPRVLRRIGDQAMALLADDPHLIELQSTWRNRVNRIDPVISENKARDLGITRSDIAAALQRSYGGLTIGAYREGDEVLPIIAAAPRVERVDPDAIHSVQVWSKAIGRAVPLSQIVEEYANRSEENRLYRQNRQYCQTIKCNTSGEMASEAFVRVASMLSGIELPEGYSLEWGGEYESSRDANASLASKLPVVGILMLLIVICLFNSVRQPLVIVLSVPLGLIGVTFGLLVFDQPFGFMSLLGFLSLVGMQIKNAIVLIDEINVQRAAGASPYDTLILAGVSRLRPVSMAALTTVLGMVPLLFDAFYAAMAVTIMCGLIFATVLTMIIVPVLYAVIFRVHPPPSPATYAEAG